MPRVGLYMTVATRDRDIMKYASLFSEESPIAEVQRTLTELLNEDTLGIAVKAAAASFTSKPKSQQLSLKHVFRSCVSILSKQNESNQSGGVLIKSNDQLLDTENLTLSQFHNAELETSPSKPRLNSTETALASSTHDDGDDITDINRTEPISPDHLVTEVPIHKSRLVQAKPLVSEAGDTSGKNLDIAPEFDSPLIVNIFKVLKVWFSILSLESTENKHNLFLGIFHNHESEDFLSSEDVSSLLSNTNIFLDRAIKLNDIRVAQSIKESIHMLHEILAAIFKTIELEARQGTPESVLTLKRLLHGFFIVDFSAKFEALLELTTSNLLFANDTIEATALSEKLASDQSLRLSYVTLSKILVCVASLANCPKNLFLEKPTSDSLDITAIDNNYINVYYHTIKITNFGDSQTVALFESRIIPYLAAEFNFYYEMSPDLLQHSRKHSSFFTWITGDALSSSLYLYTHTVEDLTDFDNQLLDPHDPFLYEVEYFEYKLKLRMFQSGEELNPNILCPSYLMISTLLLLYVDNVSFVEFLCMLRDLRIPLLNIWLCVSSYVHHYQYKSEINKQGTRMFLLTMLKLTSSGSAFLQLARGYTINESSWKFCHHKSPIIPIDKENENRPILFYVMDVLQVTFRFNLSRKLSLTNVKLALTVLYQILSFYEAHPTDDLRTYHWKELFVSLTSMLRFIAKNHNEEGVKFVIEEIFATFDLLLSPIFDKVIVDTTGNKLFGSHLIKSLNYDLLYIMLQQRDALSSLFTKYIMQTENFPRVEKAFDTFEEKLLAITSAEMSEHEVGQMISGLSILSNEEACLTSIVLEDFNNAETFKYLDRFLDEDSEQIQQSSVVLQLLLTNEWTPREVHQ